MIYIKKLIYSSVNRPYIPWLTEEYMDTWPDAGIGGPSIFLDYV
jgi:hypothetical protein